MRTGRAGRCRSARDRSARRYRARRWPAHAVAKVEAVVVSAAEDLLADPELAPAERDGVVAEPAVAEHERVRGLVELVDIVADNHRQGRVSPGFPPPVGEQPLLRRHRVVVDDAEYGLTIHRMDATFDTGGILAQVRVPVEDDDHLSNIGQKFEPLRGGAPRPCARAARGGRPRRPTVRGEWVAGVRMEDEWAEINWSRPAREVHNQVRSWVIPSPSGLKGALTELDGERVRVVRTSLHPPRRERASPARLSGARTTVSSSSGETGRSGCWRPSSRSVEALAFSRSSVLREYAAVHDRKGPRHLTRPIPLPDHFLDVGSV